ncbi:MAG: extracellular solute-binding protein [Thermosediminibacteraceae bacterium]|nr:extracellular solute-binding protein [Thermosediminibacteraceae bacterium]
MKRNVLKTICFALVLVLFLATLAGCGSTANNQGQTNDQQADPRKGVLKVAMGLAEEEWKVMKEYVFPEFEKRYGVKIEPIQMEAGDTVKKLEAMHQAGQMDIDLITQDNMQLAQLVEKGLVEDLSEYRDMIPKEVIPSLIPVGEFDGKLYFMPYRPNVEIAFYNEKKFNEYGLKPPRTWDELLQVAKTFKEKEGVGKVVIKMNLGPDSTCHMFDFIRSAGGDPTVLNDEGSVKAFTFLKEIYPYLSPESKKADWNTPNQYLATESAYLVQNWPFTSVVVVKDGGKKEIKAYQGWAGPVKESHVLGGEVIGIPKGAPNKEMAIKFMEYLMSKEVQEILTSKLGWPSMRTDAYGKVEEWQKPYFEAVSEALKHAEPRPNLTYWAEVDKAINGALREIVLEGKEVKPTLDKYHEMIEKAKQAAGGK